MTNQTNERYIAKSQIFPGTKGVDNVDIKIIDCCYYEGPVGVRDLAKFVYGRSDKTELRFIRMRIKNLEAKGHIERYM